MRAANDTSEPPRHTRCPSHHPRKRYAMTMTKKIKDIVRGVRYRAQQTRGRAKQTAGAATGKSRRRHQGKAEELRSRLHKVARRITNAIRP
jgi:uncharacterized protein YjbJ (UPF0337 family)